MNNYKIAFLAICVIAFSVSKDVLAKIPEKQPIDMVSAVIKKVSQFTNVPQREKESEAKDFSNKYLKPYLAELPVPTSLDCLVSIGKYFSSEEKNYYMRWITSKWSDGSIDNPNEFMVFQKSCQAAKVIGYASDVAKKSFAYINNHLNNLSLAQIAIMIEFLDLSGRKDIELSHKIFDLFQNTNLNNRSSASRLSPKAMLSILYYLCQSLTIEERKYIAPKVEEYGLAAKASPLETRQILLCLRQLNPDVAQKFVYSWWQSHGSEWKNWPLSDSTLLLVMAGNKQPEFQVYVNQLADFVNKQYFLNNNIRQLDYLEFSCSLLVFKRVLPAEMLTQWGKIIDSGTKQLVDLDVEQIWGVGRCLVLLNHDQTDFFARWLAATDNWKKWDLDDLSFLYSSIIPSDGQPQFDGKREEIAQLILGNRPVPDNLQDMNKWRNFLRKAYKDIPVDLRDKWFNNVTTKLMKQRFEQKDWASMVQPWMSVLSHVKGNGIISEWVKINSSWQTWNISTLCDVVSYAKANKANVAAEEIKNKVFQTYANRPLASLTIDDLLALIVIDQDGNGNNKKSDWTSAAINELGKRNVSYSDFSKCITSLNKYTPSQKDAFVRVWVSNTDTWKEWGTDELGVLCQQLDGKTLASKTYRKKIMEVFETKYLNLPLTDPCMPSDMQLRNFVVSCVFDLDGATKERWCRRLAEIFLTRNCSERKETAMDMMYPTNTFLYLGDKVKLRDFCRKFAMDVYRNEVGTPEKRKTIEVTAFFLVGEYFQLGQITKEGQEYPEYAQAVIECLRRGYIHENAYWGVFSYVSAPICSDKTRDMLKQELLSQQNVGMDMNLAKVLAYGYQNSGKAKEWHDYIESQINSAQNPDIKAQWLMAKAMAKAIEITPPSILKGEQFIDQAIATAQSAKLKMAYVNYKANAMQSIGNNEGAKSFLESVAKTFDAENAVIIEKRVAQIPQTVSTEPQPDKEQVEMADKEYRLELENRLKKAVEENDQAKVRRIERLLKQIN